MVAMGRLLGKACAAWLACGMVMAVQAHETAATREAPASFAPALSRAAASVVGVYGIDAGAQSNEPRIGAGFAVDAGGAIATSAHLVSGAQRILVRLPDKRIVQAELVGADAETDVAVIKVPPGSPLATPALGRSAALHAGDWVLAIGEPYGLTRSVSAGIVGGKDRHFTEDREVLFIQSDLALNPGNSGGPLVDASGAIVGMNARTLVSSSCGTPGLSLSIPIEIVMQVVAELQSRGETVRPRLGAYFDDVPPPVAWAAGRADARGALILSVPHGSLAERFDLHVGDIVVTMNGRHIADSADFTHALLSWHSAAGSRITVFRAGELRQLALQ
jgi:S1-C subfamily serine protease